jgi:hypothetical protein
MQKEAELALANERIQGLEAQVERMKAKKRKAIPNPNQKFMQLVDILGGNIEAVNALNQEIEVLEALSWRGD